MINASDYVHALAIRKDGANRASVGNDVPSREHDIVGQCEHRTADKLFPTLAYHFQRHHRGQDLLVELFGR
jgi:hypothetical protein